MKLPGDALLEFKIQPINGKNNVCHLVQTARFKPRGLSGLAYWYAVRPLHGVVFKGMLEGLRQAAEDMATAKHRTVPA